MKKILYIITSLDSGGEEKFLLDIYPLLTKKLDHVVCPLVHAGLLYPKNQAVKLENSKNSSFWIWLFKSDNFLAKMLKPTFWIYYIFRINRILKNQKPDVVITCTPASAFSLSMHEILTLSRKKNYIWYYRSGTHFYPKGYLPPFFRNSITRPLLEKPMRMIGAFLVRVRIKRADRFIVVNSRLKDELIYIHHIDEKNIFLLPVSLSNINPHDSSLSTKSPPFLFDKNKQYFIAAGRLKHVKGFDFLIDAIAPLLKKRDDLALIIFGDGPEKSRLLKQIKSHGLSEKIILPGSIIDPTNQISDPTAYIAPSRSEGFGKLIIEAMSKHAIVIASNCEGPTEIIDNEVDGFLFEKENKVSLIHAVEKTLSMPDEQRTHMKNNAYRKSLHFTLNHISAQFNTKLECDLC